MAKLFEWVKENPAVAALLALAGFVLWNAPIGFLQAWSALERKTLPEWLAANGWPRLRYLLFGWYGLFVLVLVGMALLLIRASFTKNNLSIPTKRDHLIGRLRELIKETDEFERNKQGVLSDFHFRVGIGNKIEQFLGLYSREWVTRFQQKKVLALEEIIKELLDGAPIPLPLEPAPKPHVSQVASLEEEYELKKLEPNFMDHGNEEVAAHNDDNGVIVRGKSPNGDSFPVLVRSFGNEHRMKKVRSVKRVSFGLNFICFDVASQHTPKNNVDIHRGAWLTEAETEIDFPANCPPRRAVIATIEGAEHRVYAVRRDSDSSYKNILPVREELVGSVYSVIMSLRVESQKTANLEYILEIVREPDEVKLFLNNAVHWKSGHLHKFISEGLGFSERLHQIWKQLDEQVPLPKLREPPHFFGLAALRTASDASEKVDYGELLERRTAMEREQQERMLGSLKDWEVRAANWADQFIGGGSRDRILNSVPSIEAGFNRAQKSPLRRLRPSAKGEAERRPPELPYWTLSDAITSKVETLLKIREELR